MGTPNSYMLPDPAWLDLDLKLWSTSAVEESSSSSEDAAFDSLADLRASERPPMTLRASTLLLSCSPRQDVARVVSARSEVTAYGSALALGLRSSR